MKNVSVFVFDCVPAGMPLLQGLASCLSVMFVWVALPLPAKSCKCISFEKRVMSLEIPITNYLQPTALRVRRFFFLCDPERSSLSLVSNPLGKTTVTYYTDFLFCRRRFIAAKATERPLNSKSQPDRCGRETLPAAMEVIHPPETDSDGRLQHINS